MASTVLRNTNYRRLWIGQTVSQFGDALYALIFLFMVAQVTGRPDMVGFVGAIQALPYLILSPFAGVLADRMDRRTIMVWSDVLSTGILIGFSVWVAYDSTPPAEAIFAVAGLLACVNVFFAPAKSAAIPRLVSDQELLEANSLSQVSQSFMPMVGLALSATVLGAIAASHPQSFFLIAIWVNALTFVYSASCLMRLPRIVPERELEPKHPLTDMKDGFRFIFHRKVLLIPVLLSSAVSLLVAPFMVVYIQANKEWFGNRFSNLAWFEFGFMAGLLAGSIWVSRWPLRRPGVAFFWGLAICGLGIAAMAVGRNFWAFFVLNLVCGIGLPFAQIPLSTAIQLITPDSFRGRVNSAMAMVAMAMSPLGMGMAGILTEAVGLVAMFLMMGLGLAGIAALGLAFREFRTLSLPSQGSASAPANEDQGFEREAAGDPDSVSGSGATLSTSTSTEANKQAPPASR
ncbi:MAG TPA: MFS transporter [Fimbriimonadaceae bacterium]|nr:MFS transporter [Fimbriimonadaceae bacterium]HRJ34148.1 MFS transporter [Fimbriimonadaceae bacterium]